MRFASLFTGFGGVEIGAIAAGLDLAWGIEKDAEIAAVANHNLGEHVQIADVLDCNPHDYEHVDILHASPPCTRASSANVNATESPLDIALAQKTADYITALTPRVFTLENVYNYRNFSSFLLICDALQKTGYRYDYWHLNAADFGVPQLRRRLILIAVRNGNHKPQRPEPTHFNPRRDGMLSALMGLKPWIGWYEAIKDLIPTLKESHFADWQLKKMPKKYKSFLLGNATRSDFVYDKESADTITANHNQSTLKTFLATAGHCNQDELTISEQQEPSFVVTASIDKTPCRAFLIGGQYAEPNTGQGGDRVPQNSGNDEPSFVVTTGDHKGWRAFSNGRVVKLSTRCLARLQTFPDWYELPNKVTLACKGIGNAVPPLLYQRIIEHALKGVEIL